MSTGEVHRLSPGLLRWVARGWSLLVFVFVVMRIITPDPYATQPVPVEDWFLLGMWGAAVLGLLICWRWERLGGILTIAIMFLRELAWVALKGRWFVNFLIVWAFLVPPAILFLVSSHLDRNRGG